MLKRCFFLNLLCFCFLLSNAQNNQALYLDAKKYFSEKEYASAKLRFNTLKFDPSFGLMSLFYHGLCNYYTNNTEGAVKDLKSVISSYTPPSNMLSETKYWLTKILMESSQFEQVFNYLKDINYSQKIDLKNRLNKNYNQADLKNYLTKNSEKRKLFDGFLKQNVKSENQQYNVAILLPFMYTSLKNPLSVIRNKFILDFYQGLLIAQEQLRKNKIHLNIYPYDTKKDEDTLKTLIKSGFLDVADIIIGPLYDHCVSELSMYALKKDIPIINPLSSDIFVALGNPNFYFLRPSLKTIGRKIGELVDSSTFQNPKKNVIIYYQTSKELEIAKNYKNEVEKKGFKIVLFEELTDESSKYLHRKLTQQYEQIIDTTEIPLQKIDSLSALPGRYIRSRRIYDKKNRDYLKDENEEYVLEYYEIKFKIPLDSIDHIFASIDDNLMINNLKGIVMTRGNTIGLIGNLVWLDYESISFKDLENMNTLLYTRDYFDKVKCNILSQKIRSKYHSNSSEFHFLGYETLMQAGTLLSDYGINFLDKKEEIKHASGHVKNGIIFNDKHKDNQMVPILKFKNLNLEPQNFNYND